MRLLLTLALSAAGFAQTITLPGQPTSTPNQVNVTTSWLYANKAGIITCPAGSYLTGTSLLGGSCAAISGLVTSVFGRTGAVVAASGDYAYSQLSGNPYSLFSASGPITFASGVIACPNCVTANAITSVFGRTGAIAAASGDYAYSQLSGNPYSLFSATGPITFTAGVIACPACTALSGLTTGAILEAASSSTLGNSPITDSGTVLTITGRNENLPGGAGVRQWNGDTGLSRNSAAGRIAVGNGTAGDASGTIVAANVQANVSIIGAAARPASDSTTAYSITNAGATHSIAIFDTTNFRLGINKTPGAFDFDVAGGINSGSSGGSTSGSYSLTGKTSGNLVKLTVADSTAAGTLMFPGATGSVDYVGTPGTSGHCPQFGSDGIGFTDAGAPCVTVVPHVIGYAFDGAGSALAARASPPIPVPFGCTINAWNLAVSPSGTATVDVWKIASGTAIPTVTNTITASAVPAIATGTALHSTTLTGWTTAVTANDLVIFNMSAVATATSVTITLGCQ